MASIFRRTIMYLGLAPEDAYEDAPRHDAEMLPMPDQTGYQDAYEQDAYETEYATEGVSNINPYNAPQISTEAAAPGPDVLNPGAQGMGIPGTGPVPQPIAADVGVSSGAPNSATPHTIAPNVFDDAQIVADRFKNLQPVILNLQGLERDLARRLLDFASGLCYGLNGEMSKVANQVYLLTPAGVEVPAEQSARF